jgi:uncharacterized protein (TIGR02444 family)
MAASSFKPATATDRNALALDNPLWRFVLPFYAREGVAPACLTLQERLGVDVNILLFAIFAQVERGLTLDNDDLATVDGLLGDWRSEVIQPLRRVRTRMKSGPAPAPSAATEPLRNRIKAAELEAEQIALAVLSAWLDAQPARATGPIATKNIPASVARYFHSGAFAPDVEAALDALLLAIRDTYADRDRRS